jgi:hypothetical protein
MENNPAEVPSGEPNETPEANQPEPEQKPFQQDAVSYETHRRLLGEKKKLKERLDALEAAQKKQAEADLEEQQKWKELADLKAKEAQAALEKYNSLESELAEGRKLSAVLKALPGNVDEKYWNLIDTSKVVFNPESGEIEAASVQEVAKNVQESYPEILRQAQAPGQPSEAPQPANTAGLLYKEWLKLPKAERDKRLHEVSDVPDSMKRGRDSSVTIQRRV